jgi:hypothetical protein
MPNAAILRGGDVIQITNLTEVFYDLDGFLFRFTVTVGNTPKTFIYVDLRDFAENKDAITNNTLKGGYYEKTGILKYMAKINDAPVEKFMPAKYVQEATSEDYVHVQKLSLISPFDTIATEDYNFKKLTPSLNDDLSIRLPNVSVEPKPVTSISPEANAFYNNQKILIAKFPQDQQVEVAKLFVESALRISIIQADIFNPYFQNDPELNTYVSDQLNEWVSGDLFQKASLEDIQGFYAHLLQYYRSAFANLLIIAEAKGYEKLYQFALVLSTTSLSLLPYKDKIRLLKFITLNKLSTVHEEEAPEELVIKILLSFSALNQNEIDPFLELLISTKMDSEKSATNSGLSITLYESLYKKMSASTKFKVGLIGLSNWVFQTQFQPTKTKDYLVQSVYYLWQLSKYNPYNTNGSFKQHTISFKSSDPTLVGFAPNPTDPNAIFTYTHYTAYAQNTDSSYTVRYPDAAPMLMPYESEKSLGIFFDNFYFVIEGDKIIANIKLPVPLTPGIEQTPGDEYTFMLYGKYHIFQPVALLNDNVESVTSITTIKGNSIVENGENLNAFIPVFVLEYIHSADNRDTVESILGFVLDVAALFDGIAALNALRYLRWAGLGAEAGTVGIFTAAGLRIVVGGVQFSAGVMGILANFIECGEDDEFCKNMKTFIAILNLATLTISAVDSSVQAIDSFANLAMRRQAAKLIEAAGGGADEATILNNLKNKITELNAGANANDVSDLAESINNSGRGYYLFSGIPVQLIEQFIKKIKNRISSENERFLAKNDISVGSSSRFVPRFSTKSYIADGFDENGFAKFKNTGEDLHSEEDLKEMAEHGKSLGLGTVNSAGNINSVTEGLIIKSYRLAKQATKEDVIAWMDNYHTFLTTRNKVPFCFNNQTHLDNFITAFKNILDKYGFSDDIESITITGSSLTKTAPPDLDLVNAMPPNTITEHLNRLKKIFETAKDNKLIKYDWIINKIDKGFKTSRKQKRIRPECIIRIENGKFYSLIKELERIPQGIRPITGKNKFDFNIFSAEDRLRSLPPEFKIDLNN